MKYIEINIDTNIEGLEPVVAELYEIGITDTVVEDPRDVEDLINKKEDYQWDYLDDSVVAQLENQPKVTVYLEDTQENRQKVAQVEQVISKLSARVKAGDFGHLADFGSLNVESKIDDDTQWKDKWKEYFKPAKISQHIVVKPTWEPYEAKDGEKILEIDPGMAFGTGTHETTSMCVEMLERFMKPSDLVLDVGCGSGILSIAAALLGAKDVLGVDIDPIAVEVSKENLALNGVESVARAQFGDLTKGIEYKADVVVANLMADLVMLLSADVRKHLVKGGYFISSGILIEKRAVVSEAIEAAGFEIVHVIEKGEWCCITAQ